MKVRVTFDFTRDDRKLIAEETGYSRGKLPTHEQLRVFATIAIEDKLTEIAEQGEAERE